MNNKLIRIICIILAFCMIVSAISVKEKLDSVNDCKSAAPNQVQRIEALDVISANNEICTTEMLGVRTVAYFTDTFKQSYKENAVRISVILLYVNSYFQCISELSRSVSWDEIPKMYLDVIILDFIHNQDGEK